MGQTQPSGKKHWEDCCRIFFFPYIFFLLPSCSCNGFLHLRHHKLNFGWCFFDVHMGHWHKAIYYSKVLNNSVSFLFLGHWGKLPPIHVLSCEFIGGWPHTTPCLYVDKNFWTLEFLVWKSQYIQPDIKTCLMIFFCTEKIIFYLQKNIEYLYSKKLSFRYLRQKLYYKLSCTTK